MANEFRRGTRIGARRRACRNFLQIKTQAQFKLLNMLHSDVWTGSCINHACPRKDAQFRIGVSKDGENRNDGLSSICWLSRCPLGNRHGRCHIALSCTGWVRRREFGRFNRDRQFFLLGRHQRPRRDCWRFHSVLCNPNPRWRHHFYTDLDGAHRRRHDYDPARDLQGP
jgi:hypothetical protein